VILREPSIPNLTGMVEPCCRFITVRRNELPWTVLIRTTFVGALRSRAGTKKPPISPVL